MMPKGTEVAVDVTVFTVAPSSAVQFTALTLDAVNAKLSAIVAATFTPALMETSILPDPPNVRVFFVDVSTGPRENRAILGAAVNQARILAGETVMHDLPNSDWKTCSETGGGAP